MKFRGFIRLWVVLSVVAYLLVAWVNDHRYFRDRQWLFQQIDPRQGYSLGPVSSDWCAVTATPEFLSKSSNDRVLTANAHFDAHARFWAEELGQQEVYRRWFVKSATMSLEEAPIKTWVDNGAYLAFPVSYRAFPAGSLPQESVLHVWFTPGGLVAAGVLSGATTGILMMVTAVVTWVVRGFRRRQPRTSTR
jgi:hypothetical protein